MMYCVTIVIVALIVCTAISLPTLLEFQVIKFKKLKQELEETKGKLWDANNNILTIKKECEMQIDDYVREFTVIYDKINGLVNKQEELANKLEKGDKE